jgi:hypothetical protein
VLHQETKQLLTRPTRLILETSVPDDFAKIVDPTRKGGRYHTIGEREIERSEYPVSEDKPVPRAGTISVGTNDLAEVVNSADGI